MRFRIETSLDLGYGAIEKKYGNILRKYDLSESDNSPYIAINSIEELSALEKDIRKFCFEYSTDDSLWYYGIMITKSLRGNEQIILIKDKFD